MAVLTINYADVVKRAATVLVQMYKEAAPSLRQDLLEYHGTAVYNRGPVGVFYEPYDVELGVGAMRKQVREAGGLLVSLLNADTAIYGAEGNAWFRFIHDMGHMLYVLEFTADDENKLHNLLWVHYLRHTPSFGKLSKLEQELVRMVYDADTTGQTNYFTEHGDFPADQTAFAIEYLKERV